MPISAVDTATMKRVWRTTWGVFQPFGGASSAYDGKSLFSAGTPPGYVFGLAKTNGSLEWAGLTADMAHYGLPVSEANGVQLASRASAGGVAIVVLPKDR